MKKLRGRTRSDLFGSLHDDIVLLILCKLSSTASSPSDLIVVLLTCKRLNKLGVHPMVLSKSCSNVFSLRAKNWCDDAYRFLKLCVNSGNTDAYYTLGMIQFYCLQNRGSGASLMAKAAFKSYAPALYSLALIQFNGSGALKSDKDLLAGVALCAQAAFLGHIDALRELGYCLQDGYGVTKNVTEGRRLLMQANAQELVSVLRSKTLKKADLNYELYNSFGIIHPASKFLVEWFGSIENELAGQGLKMCCYMGCGRPETRVNEFRRCSGCGKVKYCSRGCQVHDWRVHHKVECGPTEEWAGHAIPDVEEYNVNGEDEVILDRTTENE
ncbi:F-box protein At5g50450-like [Rutidosis leptorrhynchoides]|uniref:F-box protein At5g50450-like n=1 Tax=Rutidosis leptorrhynchoides TaxID=125765 RepID=UPI003A9A59BB